MDPQQVTLQVVMVDDEEALCLGVRRIIEQVQGARRRRAASTSPTRSATSRSGEEFLDYLAEGGEVDLLLLDLKLPGVERHGRARRAERAGPRASSPS